MPFIRPDLAALVEQSIQDIESRLPSLNVRARRSNLSVLAHVLAGGIHGLYGYLDWLAQQTLPDTASGEFLERWAVLLGIPNRKPATYFEFRYRFETSPGVVIASGALIVQTPDGRRYELAEDTSSGVHYPIGSSGLPPLFRALTSGPAANLTPAEIRALTATSPVAGFIGMVASEHPVMFPAVAVETDHQLRERILNRLRQPPHAGAAFDYETWALENVGVSQVWVMPEGNGPGSVDVRIAFTPISETDLASRWRVSAEYDAVQAYIDVRRPVTAAVRVLAPAPFSVVVDARLLRPDGLPETDIAPRSAVEAALLRLLSQADMGERISYGRLFNVMSEAVPEHEVQLITPTVTTGLILPEFALPYFLTVNWI